MLRVFDSQLCGKLAAEGNIVIAMEHRDGTGPATTYALDGTISSHYYIKVENLVSVFMANIVSFITFPIGGLINWIIQRVRCLFALSN
jgi:hypothetical protein